MLFLGGCPSGGCPWLLSLRGVQHRPAIVELYISREGVIPSSRKMKSYWRESSRGLQG